MSIKTNVCARLVCVVALLAIVLTQCCANTILTNEQLLGLEEPAFESVDVNVVSDAVQDDYTKRQDERWTLAKFPVTSRFGESAPRLALYENSHLGKKYFSEGFGGRLNAMLRQVIENHPKRDEIRKKYNGVEPRFEHHMVTMRDGVKLSTILIFPPMAEGEKRGAMMSRSPYAPTSDQVADVFTLLNGIVSIVQDQRGTFLSEGEFSMWTHDAEDGEDTLYWALKQPWSNGKLYGVGISADGCSLASLLRLSPPAPLSGSLLMWSSANGHGSTYQGGSFRAGLISGWMVLQSPLTHGVSLKKTLPELLANWKLVPNGYWEQIQGPGKWHMINWPTVHVTGWFDIFSAHQINMFNGFKESSKIEHRIVIGAIGHCILGLPPKDDPLLDIVESKAIELGYGFASELFGGFDTMGTYFKDKLDLINIYVMGSRANGRRGDAKVGHYWSSFSNWPTVDYQKLYFTPDNALVLGESAKKNLRSNVDFVEFLYDPKTPMLTHGGNNLVIHLLGFGCGSEDQRETEKRSDSIATFDLTEKLVEPLALTGHLRAVLYVSTDAKDTDFHVSLNDLHPDGHSMQIRFGLRRLKLRDSTDFETVVSEVKPNVVYKLEVDMWFTSYIVAPGHKLRVTVTSSNTPYFAVNANLGDDSDQYGVKGSQVAHNRVYFSDKYPSHVLIPVVRIEDLPRNERI